MSLDFLNSPCKEHLRNEELFGLCDDQDNTRAYSDEANTDKWIARIINKNKIEVAFTPIDNCIKIFKEGTREQESTCDGMLTSKNCLYLVELKDQITGGALSDATKQLENTMKLLLKNHDLKSFRYKKAFACNKSHHNFKVIDNEQNLRFFRTYGFRLDAQSELEIK